MKNLLKILLVLGILFSGSTYLNAKDIYLSQQTSKDYGVLVKVYDELKSGVNEINVKVFYKTKALDGVNVSFKLYKPNGEMVEYKSNTINDKNNYVFNINLEEKGEYKYVVTYNVLTGGYPRNSSRSFQL